MKPKQKLNIAIHLSNEDRFKPLLLAMFCQISKKTLNGKKNLKIDRRVKWNTPKPTEDKTFCSYARILTYLFIWKYLLTLKSLEFIVYGVPKQ